MKQYNFSCQSMPKLLGIGHVSQLLKISPSTLRTYELEGLISPEYKKGKKGYSHEQVTWIACIRYMIQDKGISIPGLTRLLKLVPCWEIADCSTKVKKTCRANRFTMRYLDRSVQWPNITLEEKGVCKSINSQVLTIQAIH